MTYFFTFLRHGESTGNHQRIIQGRMDFPLSEAGRAQAEQLAAQWDSQGKTFDGIITSPLTRARETAQIIQAHLDCPLSIDEQWIQRDYGKLEGQPLDNERGESTFPSRKHIFDPSGDNGESDWQLFLRAGEAVQSLFQNPPGSYLIVSHGGFLQQTLTIITGTKPEADQSGFIFNLTNGAYITLEYTNQRYEWRLHNLIQPESTYREIAIPEGASRYFLMRHGESEGNVAGVFQGQMETPLTSNGEQQANEAAAFFKARQSHYNLQQIFFSSQVRTQQTAAPIAEQLGLPAHSMDLLKEIANGKMSGLTSEEINALYPDRLDTRHHYMPLGETGESWFELYLRGGRIVDFLVAQPPGNYLVVSHGSILNATISSIMGIGPRSKTIFLFHNTCFAELIHTPELRQWRLMSFTSPQEQAA